MVRACLNPARRFRLIDMIKKFILILLILATVGIGCAKSQPTARPKNSMSERVTFETTDRVVIVGDYYAGPAESQTVLLLHMRPETRGSWKPFAEKLVASGFSVLTIDLRGHGESTQFEGDKVLRFKYFTEEEEQRSIRDVDAAAAWLVNTKGMKSDHLTLVGASIGANLSLQFLSEHPDVPAAVLISPGLVYRGIDIQPFIKKLQANQRVFYIAAKDDEYSALSVGAVSEKTSVSHETKIYETGGHGTKLFDSNPELMDEIVGWLLKQ